MRTFTVSWFPTALLCLFLHPVSAQAQLSRTFVSAASGNDANNCDRGTPCRTFQGAHDKTNSDGEVIVLDPGGYGTLTITKSISVVNDGVGEAGMLVSGSGTGVGIVINAGDASYVNLRGITIQGIGGFERAMVINRAYSVTITNCVIRNHVSDGILFQPQGSSLLSVSKTLVADNGGSGILVRPSTVSRAVKAVFNRVEAYNNSSDGIFVTAEVTTGGTLNATIANSIAANNGNTGFAAFSGNGAAKVDVMVVRSVSANNLRGLVSTSNSMTSTATLRVGQSTVMGNATSWSVFSTDGILQSYGNNRIDGNGDGNPAPPLITLK